MNFVKPVLAVGLAVFLSACALKALTFNQQLATGYGAATSIDVTVDTLLTAGKITSKVASNIEAQDTNLKSALDIARMTYATNATDGGNQLATALTALNALSAYLQTLPGAK